MIEKTVSDTWLLTETVCLDRLTVEEGGSIQAPAGKFVTMTVGGVGRPIVPGTYTGDIVLSVADLYHMPPHGLMRAMGRSEEFRNALVITGNQVAEAQSVPALLRRGEADGKCAKNVRIASSEESFNGILVTGDSTYEINNADIEFDGFGANDFMGVGAGVTAIDNAHVTLNDSRIVMHGVTRCAVHVGGDSVFTANNCSFLNHSPDNQEWIGDFSWGVGFVGCNRLVQLCDNGTAYYNDCDFDTNGWGVASIDGHDKAVSYYFKDCRMNLSGTNTHGYGSFCIGDRNVVSFDHCKVHVNGYSLIVRGMTGNARAEVKNGTEFTGERFGILCIGDYHTPVTIHDSTIDTDRAAIVVKGSATEFDIRNSVLKAGDNVILQLMDNDEAGMFIKTVKIPVGRQDVYDPSHDLYSADPENDVILNLTDMKVFGNFFNSTTDLHMEKEAVAGRSGKVTFGGMFDPKPDSDSISFLDDIPEEKQTEKQNYDDGLRGPKNLVLNLNNTRIEGQISSATAAYREGLTEIEEDLRLEMSNITQTAAPTVNNGVHVCMDTNSTWVVTDTSYLTKLELGKASQVKAPAGKTLTMTVDGKETELLPGGGYQGHIVLTVA